MNKSLSIFRVPFPPYTVERLDGGKVKIIFLITGAILDQQQKTLFYLICIKTKKIKVGFR